jgi:hypothetical protein
MVKGKIHDFKSKRIPYSLDSKQGVLLSDDYKAGYMIIKTKYNAFSVTQYWF